MSHGHVSECVILMIFTLGVNVFDAPHDTGVRDQRGKRALKVDAVRQDLEHGPSIWEHRLE